MRSSDGRERSIDRRRRSLRADKASCKVLHNCTRRISRERACDRRVAPMTDDPAICPLTYRTPPRVAWEFWLASRVEPVPSAIAIAACVRANGRSVVVRPDFVASQASRVEITPLASLRVVERRATRRAFVVRASSTSVFVSHATARRASLLSSSFACVRLCAASWHQVPPRRPITQACSHDVTGHSPLTTADSNQDRAGSRTRRFRHTRVNDELPG